MREIIGQALLFPVFFLCGLIIGCAAPLVDPIIGGSTDIEEQVYSHSGKGYRVAIPPARDWDVKGARIPDVLFRNKAGGGFIITGAFKKRRSVSFADVNAWWVNVISTRWSWTDIKILEERDLTLAGHSAKVVAFEFTDSRGIRRIDRTYHIYKPGGRYDLYRIRMTCVKQKYEKFFPTFEKLVKSFSFL